MQIVLHLTDLHFGYERTNRVGIAERQVCLASLIAELKELDQEWRPTIVCLTGDIGWGGDAADYSTAKVWIDSLLEALNLTYNKVVVCAGNHDVSRSAAKALARPSSSSEADDILGAMLDDKIVHPYEQPFLGFTTFCSNADIPRLTLGTASSWLVGQRTINDIRFAVLNSAWFCKDDSDEGKLWLGLPHLVYMESQGQLPLLSTSQNVPVTVGIVHHPPTWLHPEERHAWGTRQNSVDYLARRCHILLSGHTHGEIRHPDTIAQGTLHFTGGATYAERAYSNSFRLIRIQSNGVEERSFEYDPRSPDNKWRSRPATPTLFPQSQGVKSQSQNAQSTDAAQGHVKLREAARADAERHLERKSRLLRRTGILPAIVDRPVSIRVSVQHDEYTKDGALIRPDNTEQQMPLYDAVRESRRTLLLGDLGTGKSTLAAKLIIDTIDRSDDSQSVIIPAKMLSLPVHATQRDLLNSIDGYVTGQIWPHNPDIGISDLLNGRTEVLLVFDGLDELSRHEAARLLAQAATLVDNWPTIQVVCTARPVELVGVSFADWTIANTVALDESAKREFIRRELIADGRQENEVDDLASSLLKSLQEINSLDAVATSPLAIRLIYPRLASLSTAEEVSLGDMLYDLLVERFEGWQQRDDKPSQYLHLEQSLPTAIAKGEYLAALARHSVVGKSVSKDEALQILTTAARDAQNSNPHLLASEALAYFEWLSLIVISDVIEFPLQPLAEICTAVGLIPQWHANANTDNLPSKDEWRVMSFAAAIIRRRGLLGTLRSLLSSYISSLLEDSSHLTPACYIVAESGDGMLAEATVGLFNNFERHPLSLFQDEWKVSARNVASTLVLAGNVGFDWLFDHYLNPSYPVPHAGSAHIQGIFKEWATLIRPFLNDVQKERLAILIVPYEATAEANFHGVLSILSTLIPEHFSVERRISHHLTLLEHSRFAGWAEQKIWAARTNNETHELLEELLLQRARSSTHAARLWLEWNPNIAPPYPIVCLALASGVKANPSSNEVSVARQCRERLGNDRWLRFARWTIIAEERQVAAGAIKALYEGGERRLSILGRALLDAMHDGGYIPYAEMILAELVDNLGEGGVRWLADRITQTSEMDKGHSGWWRVFLARIETLDDGPEVLVSCVRGIGPFILPRYPEIRRSFEKLLSGTRGNIFHSALREALSSLDPGTRQGAAVILVSTDPQSEAEALFIAIRARSAWRTSRWDEWESFCLSLSFGQSVLVSLKSKLESLNEQSRALALVILAKGGFDLGDQYELEILESLPGHGNWHLYKESAVVKLLSSQVSFDLLIRQIEQAELSKARKSAELLLDFHRPRLDAPQEALCIVLKTSTWLGIWTLRQYMSRIAQDSVFAQQIMDASDLVQKRGNEEPILGIAARAVARNAGWEDLIWQILCNDESRFGGIGEIDDNAMALLEFGLRFPQYRSYIGRTAKTYLADPRMTTNRLHEANHWLALLADEFDGLDRSGIRSAVLRKDPLHRGALAALITRLGEVPDGFSCERAESKKSTDPVLMAPEIGASQEIIRHLMDYARDAQEIHPDILNRVMESLYLEPIEEATLTSIAGIGKPGILISTALRFVYDVPHRMEEMIPLLEVWDKIKREEKQKPYVRKLARAWSVARESVFLEDGQARTDYLTYLDRALFEDTKVLAIAAEIFEIRGMLTNEQTPLVFTEYAKHDSPLHPLLFIRICDWLSVSMDVVSEAAIARAAENAIVTLDEEPWCTEEHMNDNTWANLLFPMVIWAYTKKSSASSEAVFLRGIRSLFEFLPHSSILERPLLADLLPKLEPMMSNVPATILGNMLVRGIESAEPSVSAFCRLIAAFGIAAGAKAH